ncbi:sigma-54-dependent transcriptional regulator [Coralloluteibacterium thermophilus]|uniref:Sigma-54-dependent transcriptional regulator n=1 Tax=Coralloluteibacterium thermophilum TaxID=2707049 RepID=A0ABV9NM25_9GAMM
MPPSLPPPQGRVLLVDDDRSIVDSFRLCLEEAGHRVDAAGSRAEALARAAAESYDVCLLDRAIGSESGLDVLPELKRLAPDLAVIMVTATGDTGAALEALRAGADDYLVKPCLPDQLRIAVARQVRTRRLHSRVAALERDRGTGDDLLTSRSWRMQPLLDSARAVAPTDASVLLRGGSGTGKGVIARAIHAWSGRHGPLVTVHLPSLGPERLEPELFGVLGSLDGSTPAVSGQISQAQGGTLFLDEIAALPMALQPQLLRLLQDRTYTRMGDATPRRSEARILAATTTDLEELVATGRLRRDLYYRLNAISLSLPPLAERAEDIEPLATHFLRRYAAAYRRPARSFGNAALRRLQAYAWPGNVRELQNVVERAVILCGDERIAPQHLALAPEPGPVAQPEVSPPMTLAALERRHIRAVLARAPTLDAAARELGIDTSTLYRKRKAYGLD